MKKDKVMFIVDFGLAKEYIDPDTNKHIPYRLAFIVLISPRTSFAPFSPLASFAPHGPTAPSVLLAPFSHHAPLVPLVPLVPLAPHDPIAPYAPLSSPPPAPLARWS